jgi:Flp pilus assembly CpaE family ATPase
MPDGARIVVVAADQGVAEGVRQCLSQSGQPAVVQWFSDPAMALARVGGGDIDALVVDPDSSGAGSSGLHDLLERLPGPSHRTRTVVISVSRDWAADLRKIVAASLRQRESSEPGPASRPARKSRIIGLLGAKGGVGATTLALDVAAALAGRHSAILVELGSGSETLTLRIRTAAKSAPPYGARLDGLWAVKGIPGLRIARAQDTLSAATLAGTLEALDAEARYLLLDLGSALTPLVKSALAHLDALGVVVDMEMLSVECAKRVIGTIEQAGACPRASIGVVVVNRASLACPLSVAEVQRLLGLPVLGSIPPAGDLCNSAQRARRPVVDFEPASLAAQSFSQVAGAFAELT